MDLVDLIVIVVECLFVGFGMELGAVVAKVLTVRLLNEASPVTVHDSEDEADDEEEEEEEKKRRRRKRAAKSAGGSSTPSGFRAM
jgi:riboflavin synthase